MRGRYADDDDDGAGGIDDRRHGYRDGPGEESAGFISGGDPAGHNEFRFSGYGDGPRGGGIRLGRRLQRWGQRLAAEATGQDVSDHHAPSTTDYGNSILPGGGGGESRSVSAGAITNLTMIREGAIQRISNLHLGERIWGPSLDLNQLIMREDWGLAAMQCRMRPALAGRWLERSGFFMGRHNASVLPLHQCCALRPPVEMIQTLVLTFPAGIKAKETSFGRLPLHVACRSGASPEAVECLLAYHPEATMEGDNLQRIPLHYALKNDAGAEVDRLLLDAYPEGVTRADHRGWIPLHVACSMGTDLAIIETLLEDNPETVLVKTNKGSDCVKCARMSKGHPNEEAICAFMEEKMAEAEGRRDNDVGEDEERKEAAVADDSDSDDESHHENDDEVDLLDLGGGGDGGEAATSGEGDLLGLSSDRAENTCVAKADNLLSDTNAVKPQESASAPVPTNVENDAAPEPEALPPIPTNAPPPPEPQSVTNGGARTESAPLAFIPAGIIDESPTSTAADIDFLSMPPVDQELKAATFAPNMLGDIVLEEGSADIVSALEGNMIDL